MNARRGRLPWFSLIGCALFTVACLAMAAIGAVSGATWRALELPLGGLCFFGGGGLFLLWQADGDDSDTGWRARAGLVGMGLFGVGCVLCGHGMLADTSPGRSVLMPWLAIGFGVLVAAFATVAIATDAVHPRGLVAKNPLLTDREIRALLSAARSVREPTASRTPVPARRDIPSRRGRFGRRPFMTTVSHRSRTGESAAVALQRVLPQARWTDDASAPGCYSVTHSQPGGGPCVVVGWQGRTSDEATLSVYARRVDWQDAIAVSASLRDALGAGWDEVSA